MDLQSMDIPGDNPIEASLLALRQRMMLACEYSLFQEGMEPDTAIVTLVLNYSIGS